MNPRNTSIVRTLRLSTDPKLRRRLMVIDERVKANVRVGVLFEVLDKLAELAALRYARRTYPGVRVVTAAVDDLKVCAPPDIDRDITLLARINFVARTPWRSAYASNSPARPATARGILLLHHGGPPL